MAITIQAIETKEFKVIPRGYDPEEVDLFLDEIVDELERLQREIKSLRSESGKARAAAPAAAAPASSPARAATEETIKTMLVNAQRICDETITDTQRRADDLLQNAKQEAEAIVRDARNESKRLDTEMEALRRALVEYKERCRRLVNDQLKLIDEA
jgi:cell division initiation protein